MNHRSLTRAIGALVLLSGFLVPAVQARPAIQLGVTDSPPEIDGVLDDAAWKSAAQISDFTQVEPEQGLTPSEKTTLYLMRSRESLFVGVRCDDRDAAGIIARDKRRDSLGSGDDRVRFVLDPYGRGTDGYSFALTAGGAKAEGIVESRTTRTSYDWDAIWYGRTTVDENGWTAEFEIPFRSIAFKRDTTSWGFNIERTIRRHEEVVRWASPVRSKRLNDLEGAGQIEGIEDISTGLGLDVKPTAVARWSRGADGEDTFDFEPSLDLFYRVTPSLTATLTWNTDFAETEVDERLINLTRFPLFFPEKRAFFLEDASNFNFGGIFRSPLAFHSRTIGLSSDGEQVPLNLGAKLTGKAGPWNLGLLGVGLDSLGDLEADRSYVARISHDVGRESRVGAIYTYGSPRSNLDAQTAGLDFHLKTSQLKNGDTMELRGWGMATQNEGIDDGYGYGLRFIYPNDPLYASISVQRVGEELRPAMGFVRRPGIYEIQNAFQYTFYPENSPLKEIDLELEFDFDTDLDLNSLSEEYEIPTLDIEFDSGDEVKLGVEYNREKFLEDFEIFEDVTVPEGDYQFTRFVAGVESAASRPVRAELTTRFGDYLDGTRTSLESDLRWRPNPLLTLTAGGSANWIDIPDGEFETLIASGGLRLTPSPNLDFNTIVQYDTVSDEIGLNARLRWIVAPGNDIFLVFNQGYRLEDDRSLERLESEAVAKVGWTLRF